MLYRRVLALYTLFCLLLGMIVLPAGPRLVCRQTGLPMTVVTATPKSITRSCCAVRTHIAPDGTFHYSLSTPGCCELRPGHERHDPPALVPAGSDHTFVALLPAPIALPIPIANELASSWDLLTIVSPRGPPPTATSPRAPPASLS